MCRLCDLWGVKYKDYPPRFYFNEESYNMDLLTEDLKFGAAVTCWAANFENSRTDLGSYENSLTNHRHQLMTLKEILDVTEFVQKLIEEGKIPGGGFQVNVCGCKWITTGIKEWHCMNWLPLALEEIGFFVNVDKDMKVRDLSYQEAREELIKFEQRGLVHNYDIMRSEGDDMPWTPWVCNCEYPSCHSMRHLLHYGYVKDVHRGHYVAIPETTICNGCTKCVPWCQFGAIHVQSVTKKATINPLRCFGCGQCQTHCPESDWQRNEGAIRMVDRDKVLVAPKTVYA